MLRFPRTHPRLRTFVASLAVGSMILAACGGDDEGSTTEPAVTDATTTADDTAAPNDGTAAADGETAATTDTAEPADGTAATRTIEHSRGELEVPADPQRVVVLEPVALDTTVALGVTPVGTTVLSEDTGVPEYILAEAGEIASVGTVVEPNLEAIAAAEPDLIIGTESRLADLYDEFAAIAPTVFLANHADPWKDNVAIIAEALGREDTAVDLLDDYQARCDEIATTHGTEGQTAQLIRPRDTRLTLYGPLSFAGSTLECAGFTTPPQDWEDISLDLSPELVLDVEADLILVTTTDIHDPSQIPSQIADNPDLFPNVHAVDRAFWITGVGPLGGMTVLDDLDAILAGDER